MYVVRDCEAGNVISKHNTWTETMNALEEYEQEDRKDGCFSEDFYEVIEMEED